MEGLAGFGPWEHRPWAALSLGLMGTAQLMANTPGPLWAGRSLGTRYRLPANVCCTRLCPSQLGLPTKHGLCVTCRGRAATSHHPAPSATSSLDSGRGSSAALSPGLPRPLPARVFTSVSSVWTCSCASAPGPRWQSPRQLALGSELRPSRPHALSEWAPASLFARCGRGGQPAGPAWPGPRRGARWEQHGLLLGGEPCGHTWLPFKPPGRGGLWWQLS